MKEYMERTRELLIPTTPTPILRMRYDWGMYKVSGYTNINELVKDAITLAEEEGYQHYCTMTRRVRYAAEIVFIHYLVYPRSAMELLQEACYE